MTSISADTAGRGSPQRFQEHILPGVSRTFALTIPQLPDPLNRVVANAYLLCRIADTVEDDVGIGIHHKRAMHDLFVAVLDGLASPQQFVAAVTPLLSAEILPAERELIVNADKVLAMTAGFDDHKRDILRRHIGIMCHGMPEFQHTLKSRGLPDLDALDRYCYVVAGVVGEMLTELYCDYSADIERNRDQLYRLASSFGQGLQMTNILKDVWDDRDSGVCWLPRDVFDAADYDLSSLAPDHNRPAFTVGLERLVGIAHAHLRDALSYTLLIPPGEKGLRRFCLWSIGLAVLTLRRIHRNPLYRSAQEVKVPRPMVRLTLMVANAATGRDRLLRSLFAWSARGLPMSARAAPLPDRTRRGARTTSTGSSRARQANA